MSTLENTATLAKSQHMENYPSFKRWLNSEEVLVSEDVLGDAKDYFLAVQETHRGIRDHLGGVKRSDIAKVTEKQATADYRECKPLFDEIKKIQPLIFSDDEFSLNLLFPKQYGGQKTGKYIIDRFNNCSWHFRTDIEQQKQLGIILAKLGQKWANARTKEAKYRWFMTTSSESFLSLGHYYVDKYSCFEFKGENEDNKVELATSIKNSFVVVASTDTASDRERPEDANNIFRCWGFMPNNKTIVFTNSYAKRITEGDKKEILKSIASTILKTNKEDLHPTLCLRPFNKIKSIYTNGDQMGFSKDPVTRVQLD